MLSLKEFEKLPTDELCARVNEMSRTPSHYRPDVMSSHGYAFTWASMKSVAERRGLVTGYYDPEQAGVRAVCIGGDGVEVDLKSRDAYTRRSFAIEKDTADRLSTVLDAVDGLCSKGAVLTAVVECGLNALENAKKNGRLTVTAKNLTGEREE